jgi:hypothetical protein
MNDLNWYLMNKDHDFLSGGGGGGISVGPGPIIGKQHLIGINPPPTGPNHVSVPSSGDDKTKIGKIKPSISRERVGLNPNQLLINLQNYNFKQMMNAPSAP